MGSQLGAAIYISGCRISKMVGKHWANPFRRKNLIKVSNFTESYRVVEGNDRFSPYNCS